LATEDELINSLKTDWKPTDYYNFDDLNRVEEITVIIQERVALFRGYTISLEPTTTDRTTKSIEFAESLNRIERNIEALQRSFSVLSEKFEPLKLDWVYNDSFDFNDANRYEKNLYVIYNHIQGNIYNIHYCGQYTLTTEEGVL
jgi:hypothetical protein